MRSAIVVGLIGSMAQVSLAFAIDLPNHHAEICVDAVINKETVSVVSKKKLARLVLNSSAAAQTLYINVDDDEVHPKSGPKWRAILRDTEFCATSPGCLAPSSQKPDIDPTDTSKINRKPPLGVKPAPGQIAVDNLAARATLMDLRRTFAETILLATKQTGRFSTANPTMGRSYLDSLDDTVSPILCIGEDLKPPPDPIVIATPAKDKLRLRANSDDLRIKTSNQAFGDLNPATINYTADNVAGTRVVKGQAALGYAFQLPFNDYMPKGYSFFDGELIPYISAQQKLTKKNGELATHADADNVAVGTLFKLETMLDAAPGLLNVVSAQPQYLWNTKDKSEIASFRFIYQPFFVPSDGTKINVPNAIPFFGAFGGNWLTLIFDLRNDVGEYTKRTIDPVAALRQDSFNRAGSKFGFSLSTDPSKAHVVLRVTETLLYGFKGSVRWLDYFDSSLTYYFDSTSNFGLSLSYTKGVNEDTAERAQTYMAGLSAKF
jgi:hypothetical protein